ncbi:MAG: twin-arginine translocase subunit TatC [Bacteroidales bacterium]|nr:twin-arginine translocase subunit TatC [Bacteroidales bacterium]
MEETFWEHLDDLRSVIIRILIIASVFSVAAFFLKDWLFDIIFAPKSSSFISYKFLGGEDFNISLMNTELTGQFMMHLKVSVVTGIIAASPYIIYELFRFVSPALYENEKKYSSRIVLSAYMMFVLGAVINYFLIFPLTLRFLGTYEVSTEVRNMLTLDSYMDTLLMMTLVFGIVFEIPVLSWLLGKFGLLKSKWMKKYRRHAVVVILIMAAIITPTSDVFTLTIVFLPIWLLYEISVLVVKRIEK